MAISKEDFDKAIQEIGTCEDDSERRTMLAKLTNDSEELFNDVDSLTRSNEELNAKVKKLQEDNMDLFLQIGSKTTEEKKKEEGFEEPPKKREFKDLFDEKGGLK